MRTILGTLTEPDFDNITGKFLFIAEQNTKTVPKTATGILPVIDGAYSGDIADGVYTVSLQYVDTVDDTTRTVELGLGVVVIPGNPIDVFTLLGLSDIPTPISQAVIDAAITAHTAEPDPHSQYATPAEAADAAPVQTVFGRSGTVVAQEGDYTKDQVGLGNVDNTSDANKPVSTAQQTALDFKAPLASPAFTGTPTAPTAASGTNTTQIATTAFVASVVGDIDAALDTINGEVI